MDNDNSPENKDWLRKNLNPLANEQMPTDAKERLWERIRYSTETRKGRQIPLYQVAAACLLVALTGLGVWVFFQQTSNNSFEAMRSLAAEVAAESDRTELVLADNRNLTLDATETEITYEKESGEINISNQKPIAQSWESGMTAFNTLVVPYGRRANLTLSDGTKVWVNSGSKLVYPVVFSENKREIFLEGEAYFEVAQNKNAPMTVYSRDLNIHVVGTRFDLSAYPDDPRAYAVLASGAIDLTTGNSVAFKNNRTRIKPGQMAEYGSETKKIEIREVDTADYLAWTHGYLSLNSAQLSDIAKKLSRYYRIELSIAGNLDKSQTLSGKLILQDNVLDTIEILCSTSTLSYEKTPGGILLKPGTDL